MQYRPEIDGLRAVAVLPVILFHAGFGVFSGGFIGVDVFFVISGYLITNILLHDLSSGKFSILQFYERRARRIVPALFTVMLACLPFAYVWMLPSQLEEFSKSIISVVLFSSNIFFWSQEGYFASASELKPLLHTWSLAVEEQYYLVFPFFLAFLSRAGRRRVFLSVIFLAILSFLLAEWGWRNAPNANFYLAPTRAWELLGGSICAFLAADRAQRSSNALSAAGLSLILLSIFCYGDSTPFPGVYALGPVLGAMLIILFAGQGTWVARLLSSRGLVGVGLISYSAYLWHQPLYAFARLRSLTEPGQALMLLLAAASLLLAWATWRYVEQPFRRRKNPLLASRKHVFAASIIGGSAFFALGVAGDAGEGFAWRNAKLESMDARLALNYGLHRDCEGEFNSSKNCSTSESPDVLLWGDSFAMHLAQGLVASDADIAMQQHTMSACAPVLGLAPSGPDFRPDRARRCIEFNDKVMNWLENHKTVDLVILSSRFSQLFWDDVVIAGGEVKKTPTIEYIDGHLQKTVEGIRRTGARVVIVSPTPVSGWDNGQCLMRSIYFENPDYPCDFSVDMEISSKNLLEVAEKYVPVYWLQEDICPDNICDVMQGDILIYRDDGHLSKEGSAYLGRTNSWMEKFRRLANAAEENQASNTN